MCLYDIKDEQLEGAKTAIQSQLEELEGQGLLREGQTAVQLLKRVAFSSDLKDAVDGADYIQVIRIVIRIPLLLMYDPN